MENAIRGSLWAIFLYDVAEQIQLDKLRGILGIEPPAREPRFKHPAPDYVPILRVPPSNRPLKSRHSNREKRCMPSSSISTMVS